MADRATQRHMLKSIRAGVFTYFVLGLAGQTPGPRNGSSVPIRPNRLPSRPGLPDVGELVHA